MDQRDIDFADTVVRDEKNEKKITRTVASIMAILKALPSPRYAEVILQIAAHQLMREGYRRNMKAEALAQVDAHAEWMREQINEDPWWKVN